MRGRKTGTDADGARRTSIRLRFRERPERVPHFERTSSANGRGASRQPSRRSYRRFCPLFAGRWPLSIVRWPPLPADRSASAANRIKSGSASAPIRLRFGSSSAAPRLQFGSGSAEQRQTPEPRRRQVLHPALQTTRTVFQFIDRGDAGLDRRDNIGLLVVGYDTLAAVVLQTLLRTYPANRE